MFNIKKEETMDERENKTGTFENLKKVFHKDKPEFTAEYAWLETTYGNGGFRTLEQRVKDKQEYIKSLIKSKFPSHETARFDASNGSYRCVVDIEEDLVCCVGEVFKPFIDGGFKIINLSEVVKEIDDENVYLISWKKTFKEKHKELLTQTNTDGENKNI